MISFSLPVPPGVNNLYPTVQTAKGPKRVKSTAYRAWQHEAGWMVPRAAKGVAPKWFRLNLQFDRPDKGNRADLDGRIKAVLDLLKKAEVITDDRWNEGMIIDWSSPCTAPVYPANPMVRVTVTPVESAA